MGPVCKDLREALLHKARPVLDGVSHKSTVDIIKPLAIRPFEFNVIDFEAHIGRYPVVDLEPCHMVSSAWEAYQRGWIGLRSLPRTCVASTT